VRTVNASPNFERTQGSVVIGAFVILMEAIRRLKRDQRGAALVYFTVAVLPLLTVVGIGVDLGRIFLVKQRLANAADAAAIAVGAQSGLTSEEVAALADAFIRVHYPDTIKALGVDNTATQVDVTVTVQVPMVFLQILNTQSIEISVNARALRPQGKLEVALVLDQTGSMGGQRISDLKAAAKDLIDIVVWNNQTADFYAKVALVPYSAAVDVGGYAASVRGTITSGTCSLLGCQFFQFLNALGQLKIFQVTSCVTERTGAQAYTDATPTVALLGPNYTTASNPCPSNTIKPLTNDKTLLKGQIDLLQAAGSTAGHIGLAWGWYLLSPDWGYLWPASQPASYEDLDKLDAKGQPLLQKIIVLMTDGAFNTAYCQGVISKDSGAGSGSSADHINCNATNGASLSQAQTLCGGIKAKGITVYTVGFGIADDTGVRDMMTNCATDTSHAYLASSGDELKQAFREIATKISSLRLSH
jgi:Flp pilus assembly protein TadG